MAVLYGFHSLEDVLDQRVTAVQPRILSNAVEVTRQLHNQEITSSLALLATRTTDHQIGYNFMGEGELQGVDEWGRPDPIRMVPPAARYFPIRMAQASIGTNWVLAQKMTVQEVNDRLVTLFTADAKWMRKQLMAALFQNTAYNFADPQYGTLSIAGLANGDAETYIRESTGTASVDTHHIGSGTGTFAEADLTTLRTELVEHPENGGSDAEVCVLLSTTPAASALGFTNTIDAIDNNVVLGTATAQYTGESTFGSLPGRSIGYNTAGMVHLRQWDRLPDNYAVAVTNLGDPPLAMREDPEASLQGFGEIPGREDMPYLLRTWSRRAGFGGYSRVGAVVMRCNNSVYAVPSGYAAPQ